MGSPRGANFAWRMSATESPPEPPSASGPSDPKPEPKPDPNPEPGPKPKAPRRGFDPRLLLALVAIVVIAGGIAVLTQGGGGGRPSLPGNATSVASASFRGSEASPPAPAPALALRNYLGQRIDLAQYRGKAVFITFIYTHCPDVCPLIAANLRVAQSLMGAGQLARTQMIAVSVDPRGDTRASVAAFLKRHELTGRMQYLVGSAHELGRVWEAWHVGSERDAQQPALVNHTGLVYGLSAGGRLTTLYAANFKPSDVAHDAPLLSAR